MDPATQHAVRMFWLALAKQRKKQAGRLGQRGDRGSRSSVTGGAQMDGFVEVMCKDLELAGIERSCMHVKTTVELPGYYRPTKKWDLIVVRGGQLLAAVETKSHIGPSFGNNFNNRVEEAIGSSTDLWTAFREKAFKSSPQPWLGYVMLLEDCEKSKAPVREKEPHFEVFPEFKGASYARRYELLCERLIRERNYSACALLMSSREQAHDGRYREPVEMMSFVRFRRQLVAHLASR